MYDVAVLSVNLFSCPNFDDVFGSNVVETRPVVDIELCSASLSFAGNRNAACRLPFPISCFISREICFLLAVIGI